MHIAPQVMAANCRRSVRQSAGYQFSIRNRIKRKFGCRWIGGGTNYRPSGMPWGEQVAFS
jgi:hypothetical protein